MKSYTNRQRNFSSRDFWPKPPNTEKLVALQISSVQSYTALGFTLLRAALEVKAAEKLQAYIAKQNELVKSASEKFVGDAKAVAELGVVTSAQRLRN